MDSKNKLIIDLEVVSGSVVSRSGWVCLVANECVRRFGCEALITNGDLDVGRHLEKKG